MEKEEIYDIDGIKKEIEEISFDNIKEKDEKKIITKLISIFCNVDKINNKTINDVKELFEISISKANKYTDYFLNEVFLHFFNKKEEHEVYKTLEEYVIANLKLFSTFEVNIIDKLIVETKESNDISSLKCYLAKYIKDENPILPKETVILCFLILFLIKAQRRYPTSNENLIKRIEKAFIEDVAEINKDDKFFIKTIFKALLDTNYKRRFNDFCYIYTDTTEVIKELEHNKKLLQEHIDYQKEVISNLNNNKRELEIRNNELLESLEMKNKELEIVNKNVEDSDNQNKHNKKVYEDIIQKLKFEIISNLKNDLKLEIEGLEDLADMLQDSYRTQLQRQIDNIVRILNKRN